MYYGEIDPRHHNFWLPGEFLVSVQNPLGKILFVDFSKDLTPYTEDEANTSYLWTFL